MHQALAASWVVSHSYHFRHLEVVGKQILSAQQNHLQLSFQKSQYSTPFSTSHPQYMGPCHVSESNHSERDQPSWPLNASPDSAPAALPLESAFCFAAIPDSGFMPETQNRCHVLHNQLSIFCMISVHVRCQENWGIGSTWYSHWPGITSPLIPLMLMSA